MTPRILRKPLTKKSGPIAVDEEEGVHDVDRPTRTILNRWMAMPTTKRKPLTSMLKLLLMTMTTTIVADAATTKLLGIARSRPGKKPSAWLSKTISALASPPRNANVAVVDGVTRRKTKRLRT